MSDTVASLLPAGLSPWIALALIVLSFFTSAMTAAFGIGGGVAMLGGLASAVPPATIVAVHGLVQFGSNIGRTVVQRAHVVWRPVALFAIGSIIGVGFGAWLVASLPARWLLLLLGLFILAMVWLPKPKIPGLERSGLIAGGVIASVLSMVVGAVGPFVQALLLPLKLEKRALIATFSAMQTLQHALKVIAFGAIGFSFGDWLPLTLAMIASGFLGTLAGTALLERIPEHIFAIALKVVLTIAGLDLLRQAALSG
ncbi:sulfite exporter TauE/SafE family protein [Terrarubrum flagellatum]|uniref:sulfite exporter TauE/SafE family protein n=1 Tax=Terrirubrum flagellatum TaxID=2895980 RepID=UPI003145696D